MHRLGYRKQRFIKKENTLMLVVALLVIYALALIVLANVAEESYERVPIVTMMTLGLTQLGGLWKAVAAVIGRFSSFDAPTFDRNKLVHRIAALLMIAGFCAAGVIAAKGSDSADWARYDRDQGEAVLNIVGSAGLYTVLAFAGVGYVIRRPLAAVLRRLGLRMPSRTDILLGFGMGIVLYVFALAATALWSALVPAEVFEAQTESARRIVAAYQSSFSAALLLAGLSATSEEILFRGALQPVFGVLLTSMFFTAAHLQYALSPAALILFFVSLGFAWLRLRFSTVTAIFAHATYNFLPFLIAGQTAS